MFTRLYYKQANLPFILFLLHPCKDVTTIPFQLVLFSAGKVYPCPIFNILFPPLLSTSSSVDAVLIKAKTGADTCLKGIFTLKMLLRDKSI